MKPLQGLISAASLLFSVCALANSGAAQTEPFKGKTITFIVTTGAGSGYDTSARLIANYLPKYLPGKPSIVVQNMTGAGGVVPMNWLYNLAPKDGLTIGMINTDIAFNPLYGDSQARYEPSKFSWLGSPSKETGLLVTWRTSSVKSIEDAKTKPLLLAATGITSQPAVYARVLSYVLDFKMKLVMGYSTQLESLMAMERGENDENAAPYWSTLQATKPEWISDKKIRVLVYYGPDKVPDIDGPYVFDLIKDPEKKAIMEFAEAGLTLGRPIIAPPQIPPAMKSYLRDALTKVFADPQYVQDCHRARLACDTPLSGEELDAVVKSVYDQPKDVVKKGSTLLYPTP